jgi:hypothetical protein
MSGLKRLASLTAAVVLVLTGAVAVTATSAQAAPPGCSQGRGHYEQAGAYIYAYNYWFCDDGNDIPLAVSIARYLSPGVYEIVASGSGETTYNCQGTLYNVYRAAGTPDFAILCS